jgi:hypothetical protein
LSSGNWIHETKAKKKSLRFESPAGVRRHLAFILKKYEEQNKEEQIELVPVVRTIGFMAAKIIEAFRIERENELQKQFDEVREILRERGLL